MSKKSIQIEGLTVDELFDELGSIRHQISNIRESQAQKQDEVRFLTRPEVCKKLKVTAPTLIKWDADGTLPAIRIGTMVRYTDKQINELMNKKGGEK